MIPRCKKVFSIISGNHGKKKKKTPRSIRTDGKYDDSYDYIYMCI